MIKGFITTISLIFTMNCFSSIETFFNRNSRYRYKTPYRKLSKKGQNLEQKIINYIRSAKTSVYVAVYELRLPSIAKELVKAKENGIDVRVIVDNENNNSVLTLGENYNGDKNSRYKEYFKFIDINADGKLTKRELLQRDAIYILKVGGIKVIDDSDGGAGANLMHHKFVVVDGIKVLTSSANFTMSGIHGDYHNRKSLGNANAMITFSDKDLAQYFSREFLLMWGGKSGRQKKQFGISKIARLPFKKTINGKKVTVQFSPVSKRLKWNRSVNALIAKHLLTAKNEIIAALFVFSSQKLADALKYVFDRNDIDLSILSHGEYAYRGFSETLDLWGLELLNESCNSELNNNVWRRNNSAKVGVARLTLGDKLHHKFAVIDRKKVVFGSQNWTDAANHHNDEFAMIIEGKVIAESFRAEFVSLARLGSFGAPKFLTEKIKLMEDFCKDNKSIIEQYYR